MGDDINCRFGDFNSAFHDFKLCYATNIDSVSNFHGIDTCIAGNVSSLSHLIHENKKFDGNFAYFKVNKKSQIDMIYTNQEGVKFVKDLLSTGIYQTTDL